jgi:hypothetical protein
MKEDEIAPAYQEVLRKFNNVYNDQGGMEPKEFYAKLDTAIEDHDAMVKNLPPVQAKDVANNLRLLKILKATKPLEDSLKATDEADTHIKEMLFASIERERARVEYEMTGPESKYLKYGIKPPKGEPSQKSQQFI